MSKAIIFDLDDTLFPEYEFALSGFQVVSDWVKQNILSLVSLNSHGNFLKRENVTLSLT